MFTTTGENEVALSLLCDFGIFSQDQFCLQIEVNLWRKEEGKYFRKLTCQQVNKAKNIGDKQRSSLTNSRGSRVAGPQSRSRVQSRGRGSKVAAGENDLGFEVTE